MWRVKTLFQESNGIPGMDIYFKLLKTQTLTQYIYQLVLSKLFRASEKVTLIMATTLVNFCLILFTQW